MAKTVYVYRDGKIQEVDEGSLERIPHVGRMSGHEKARQSGIRAIPYASEMAHTAIEDHKSGKKQLRGIERSNITEI
jgi:hypothetical protein